MPFCFIYSSTGYSFEGAPDGFKSALLGLRNEKITVVAFEKYYGHYFVANATGAASWSGPQNFSDKVNSIKCSDIKQVSFGPSNTWAIVMKNGFCHYYAFSSPEGPKSAIDKHQNKISYVAMSAYKNQWIVGNGDNGFSSMGCNDCLLATLRAVPKVYCVTMGYDKDVYFVHHEGRNTWNGIDGDFTAKFKKAHPTGHIVIAIS